MRGEVRRLGRAILDPTPAGRAQPSEFRTGTVTVVSPLTVQLADGTTVAGLTRLLSYPTPAVGDVVRLERHGPTLFVLGRIIDAATVNLPAVGQVAVATPTTASVTVTTTQTTVKSLTGVAMLAGRRYKVTIAYAAVNSSVANDDMGISLFGGPSGSQTQLQGYGRYRMTTVGQNFFGGNIIAFIAPLGSNATWDFSLRATILGTGPGQVYASATNPIEIIVEDIGV